MLGGARWGEKASPVRYNPTVRASVLAPTNPPKDRLGLATVVRSAGGPGAGALLFFGFPFPLYTKRMFDCKRFLR